MKKTPSLLPLLNIFATLIHLTLFVLTYADVKFFGDPFPIMLAWAIPFVGAVALLFIIQTVIIAIRTKKLPDSFLYVVSYFFTVIYLCVSGYYIYDFLDAWFMF
ncbi:MAG: hypothetical protein II356_06265 [Clostridia bacterium]|nr:hypothetical protein [Clostridia bacterium]MBQ1995471.1 hypothetical protein [Clostridia bacterium]MBQ5905810.1 hypothetical protein [Clostridia bacterium]